MSRFGALGANNNGFKHGYSNTPEYWSWKGMMRRCSDKKYKDFHNYGGRGIRVCKRWLEIENFIADMGVRPVGTSLDRINNNGHYTPSNCRWATKQEQRQNSRTSKLRPRDVRYIRTLLARGVPAPRIGEMFKVSEKNVRNIRDRLIWTNIS